MLKVVLIVETPDSDVLDAIAPDKSGAATVDGAQSKTSGVVVQNSHYVAASQQTEHAEGTDSGLSNTFGKELIHTGFVCRSRFRARRCACAEYGH